jgi:signal peptidase II
MNELTKKHALPLALTALVIIVLDQVSKWAMLNIVDIASRPPIEVTPFFRLVMVWNQGVSFGMLNHPTEFMPWLLVIMAVVIALVLLRLGLKSELWLERIGYGMVIGGALGNVIDRLRFRAVADFFYFHLNDLGWPAFNVADAAICVGVIILLWMMLKHPARP